ncbi:MAG: YbjQ family protein [Mariprofundaceae bacterium]|nr:YbjQ family protein [Mariprofundaceae bacterium]
MILSNMEQVSGKRVVKHLGVVNGSTVRAKHVGRDIMASLKNIFGGRVTSYETLLDRARREARLRMAEQARSMGAKMIFNIKLETSSLYKGRRKSIGSVEVLAYGTALIPGK